MLLSHYTFGTDTFPACQRYNHNPATEACDHAPVLCIQTCSNNPDMNQLRKLLQNQQCLCKTAFACQLSCHAIIAERMAQA